MPRQVQLQRLQDGAPGAEDLLVVKKAVIQDTAAFGGGSAEAEPALSSSPGAFDCGVDDAMLGMGIPSRRGRGQILGVGHAVVMEEDGTRLELLRGVLGRPASQHFQAVRKAAGEQPDFLQAVDRVDAVPMLQCLGQQWPEVFPCAWACLDVVTIGDFQRILPGAGRRTQGRGASGPVCWRAAPAWFAHPADAARTGLLRWAAGGTDEG